MTNMKVLTKNSIQSILTTRNPFSHKGNFGHALIIAGNTGKMGAAVIAAKACMRAGVGKLTVSVPQDEVTILPIALPEAMICIREKDCDNFDLFTAAGIGCGIGVSKENFQILTYLLEQFKKPILLDADALNIIAVNNSLLNKLPINTILTPHPKEFDRLFGAHTSHEERKLTAITKAKELHIMIVLKDHKTLITYDGKAFENRTGNAGLAKAGSGDALSGVITSFLAQGYHPFDAAKIGVYLHGLAADICLKKQSMESMLVTDVIDCFGKAFKKIME
jgi:hydroxyethylthiazole kinase-like uncharacterized protein yjeF